MNQGMKKAGMSVRREAERTLRSADMVFPVKMNGPLTRFDMLLRQEVKRQLSDVQKESCSAPKCKMFSVGLAATVTCLF
jgi:hypothetical protein